MTTYFVVNSRVDDAELLEAYRDVAQSIQKGEKDRVLISVSNAETVEGEPAGGRLTVVEFPNREAFEAWYYSPEYQAVVGTRLQATTGFAVVASTDE